MGKKSKKCLLLFGDNGSNKKNHSLAGKRSKSFDALDQDISEKRLQKRFSVTSEKCVGIYTCDIFPTPAVADIQTVQMQ